MDDGVEQLKREGAEPADEDLARLSPLVHEHTKMLGTSTSPSPTGLTAGRRRALRAPDERP